MNIQIHRDPRSYEYKRRGEGSSDAWDNNDSNNMLDTLELWHEGALLHSCPVQTVANIPGGRYLNTIACGTFGVKIFVEPRAYRGRIHGIIDAIDLEGQHIDGRSIEPVPGKDGAPVDFERWLVHDTQKHAPAPAGSVTRVAWSAGCIIMGPMDLEVLAELFELHALEPGSIVAAYLGMK